MLMSTKRHQSASPYGLWLKSGVSSNPHGAWMDIGVVLQRAVSYEVEFDLDCGRD